MNDCQSYILIEEQSAPCFKVLDHTGKHKATIYIAEYGEVNVEWTQ